MKIGGLNLGGNVFLAPMAGVADEAFRRTAKPFGPALMYTEMVSAKGLLYGSEKTEELLRVFEEERPIGAQIFGHEPEVMAEAARTAEEFGADLIDINMGCPMPKITKNGDGCALMKDPLLAGEIIKTVKNAVTRPVTAKFRSGIDQDHINAPEFAKIMEESGADAVTIHGRTGAMLYSGRADLEIIKQVKEAVNIPVIGNGDITDGESAEQMLSMTGCDGVMVGRAARGNPWIFSQINSYLTEGKILPPPSLEERKKTAARHIELLVELKGERRGTLEGRKQMAWYFKGRPQGAVLREKLNKCETPEEILRIIR